MSLNVVKIDKVILCKLRLSGEVNSNWVQFGYISFETIYTRNKNASK